MADDSKKRTFPVEPFDPEKIIRRKCPSGMVLELYPAANRLQTLQFLKLGLTPDPRTHHPAIREMTIYPDDVIICAYVKAGTHWVWEMTKMLLKGEAEYDPSPKEVAMLEFHPLDLFENMARPRVLNTHNTVPDLPNALRDGIGRMIFVQRNPKDVAVSFYNHLANMKGGFKGTWEDYAYLFNNFGGYHNDWFKYTLGFDEELKSNKKMKYHMMYYEDIKKDPLKSIHELAKFLEVKCSDQLSMEIADKCSFTRLKHASENLKFDHINNTKPNSEFENPGAMYRKGNSNGQIISCKILPRKLASKHDSIHSCADDCRIDASFTKLVHDCIVLEDGLCKTLFHSNDMKCKHSPSARCQQPSMTPAPSHLSVVKVIWEIGDWKNWFTVAQSEEFNQVFDEKMKNCSFSFKFTGDSH